MRRKQKGYALIDTLIAAAIAAGVAVAIGQSLAVVARSASAAKSLNAVVSDAEIIAARLDAGIRSDAALLDGLSGWTVARSVYQPEDVQGASQEARMTRYAVAHQAEPAFSFQRIVLSEARP